MTTGHLKILLTLTIVCLGIIFAPAHETRAGTPISRQVFVLGASQINLVSNNAVTSNNQAALGDCSWRHDGTSGGKLEFFLTPVSLGFGTLKFGDLQFIRYRTWKPFGNQSSADFYLQMNSDPFNTAGRPTAEPLYVNNENAPASTWNTWSTDPGTNQLVFSDSLAAPNGAGTNPGFYSGPTLQTITGGPVNWGSFAGSGSSSVFDYSTVNINRIGIDTASNTTGLWGTFYSNPGYLDYIEIQANTSSGPRLVIIDLECEDIDPPQISKTFTPNNIPVGSSTTLQFTITNPNATPISDVSFIDSLSALVSVTPAVTPACGGTLTVTAASISLDNGFINANANCV